MKLTTLLLLAAFLQVSARSTAQTVTFSGRNVDLETVLSAIKKQTGYHFFYSSEDMALARPVTVRFANTPVEEALAKVMQGQPLAFSVKNTTVFIKARERSIENLEAELPAPAPVDVRGKVVDESGEPLAGVSVIVKGTSRGTQTNGNGEFSFAGIAENAVLVFSGVNIETYETPLNGRTDLLIRTKAKTSVLQDVVVNKGYYSTTQKLNTGAVSKITSEEIEKQPVNNPLLAVQGRIPGLFLTQSSGLPGADITVRVRGTNSINNTSLSTVTNAPLYVVDGVPYPAEAINRQASSAGATGRNLFLTGPNGFGSPLSFINPNDIESIEVLKDADATAIYGSRGANGVILITTKKGRSGKTKLDVNVRSGAGWYPNQIELLSTAQYRELRRQAFRNDNRTPTATLAPDLLLWDSTQTINFQEELLGKTAHYTDAQASFSGGTRKQNFIVSGNFRKENSIYVDRRSNNSGGAHMSLVHASDNNRFGTAVNVTYNVNTINLPSGNYMLAALSLSPNYPLYDSTGKLYWSPVGNENPLGTLNRLYNSQARNLIAGTDFQFTILEGLTAKTRVGYNRIDYTQRSTVPSNSFNPIAAIQPSARFANTTTQTTTVEPQLEYNRKIAKGTLGLLLGGTYQHTIYEQPYYIEASGFAADIFLTNVALAGTRNVFNGFNEYKYASLFSRINYNWADKYIINGVFRRDGSSKFGPDRRFGNFGAVGAAWIFSNEAAVQKALPWLSFGKIRSSYGIVGSDNIADYGYLPTYVGSRFPYGTGQGLVPARIANLEYSWEESKKIELGLDLGFFSDRIVLNASLYRNRSGNQLVGQPLSAQAGFTSFQANLPATVQNAGLELALNTVNIRNANFTWSTTFTLTRNTNKLLAFSNLAGTSYANQFVVGNPINSIYAFQFTGVDSLGLPTVKDQNGDGRIDFALAASGRGDAVYVGKQEPDYFGGLSNTFRYKGLQVDVFFQYMAGYQVTNQLSNFTPGVLNSNSGNYPLFLLEQINALTPGKATPLATTLTSGRAYNAYRNYIASDAAAVSNASFVRLSNVALSYSLAQNWLAKARMSAASIFVQGQNLYTFTRFKGPDPETGYLAVPPLRRIVAGLQFSF